MTPLLAIIEMPYQLYCLIHCDVSDCSC